jgi:putative spermidine/putrescine transport system permease protein
MRTTPPEHAEGHPMSSNRALGRWAGRLAVAGLVAFMTLPTLVVVVASFNASAILAFPPQGYSLRWYANALTYPQFQRAAVNSLLVTAASAALALPVGTAAVLALERGRVPGRGLWAAVLLSPLIIPGVVSGLGLLILAAGLGLLRSRWVLIFAHLVLILPFVVRSLWVSAANLDPDLERAAASLGAARWRVFRWVTLPLLRPGLFAALLFAAIISLNEFVVSLFISTRVTEILPVAMFTYVVNYTDPTIAALSALFIAGTFAAIFLADRLLDMGSVFQLARAGGRAEA